jgi:hypothetical protein
LNHLWAILRSVGWEKSRTELRTFRHATEGQLIEVEPGGSDTTGHVLHYMSVLPD